MKALSVFAFGVSTSIFAGTAFSVPALPTINEDEYLDTPSGGTYPDVTVEGTLRLSGIGSLTAGTFGLGVDEAGNGGVNATAPGGELNGDANFDSGAANLGDITAGKATRLFVNDGMTSFLANSITTSGETRVGTSTVNISGSIATAGPVSVASGGTINAGSVTFLSVDAQLAGSGTVDADAFTLGQLGQIKPADDGVGTLTLKSPSTIDLSNTLLPLDITPGSLENDQLVVEGDVSGSLLVLAFGFQTAGATAAELAAHGPFVFLVADSITGVPEDAEPSFTEIRDENDILVGNMLIGTTATTAYFYYQAVPEPSILGVSSLGLLALRRRPRG